MTIEDSPLIHAFTDVARAKTPADLGRIATARARSLVRADGCTLVLRDGELCSYVDEDAISPLWKGRRFPMSSCISGWVMRERDYVVIEDIRGDLRIPHDLYMTTFVRSMAMVPIGREQPIGALGAYWSSRHAADPVQLECLHTLADAVAVALNGRLREARSLVGN